MLQAVRKTRKHTNKRYTSTLCTHTQYTTYTKAHKNTQNTIGYGKHGHGWRLTVDPPTGAVAITANGDRVLLLIPDAHGVLQQPGVVYCRNRFEYAYDDDANAGLPSAVQFTAACFSGVCVCCICMYIQCALCVV